MVLYCVGGMGEWLGKSNKHMKHRVGLDCDDSRRAEDARGAIAFFAPLLIRLA